MGHDTSDTHKNAPLTPKGRETMVRSVVEGGRSRAAAARQFNTKPKIVAEWVLNASARCGWFAGSVLTAPFVAWPKHPSAASVWPRTTC